MQIFCRLIALLVMPLPGVQPLAGEGAVSVSGLLAALAGPRVRAQLAAQGMEAP